MAVVPMVALPSARPAAATATYVRATFSAPIRWEGGSHDGHVNVMRTVDRLQALHANAYAFQIKRETDWGDLQKFAPAAQAGGLQVWVYLPPPSRPSDDEPCPKGVEPYRDDYEAWATAIARLSVRYPAVTAWTIDDFATHLDDTVQPPPDTCKVRSWVFLRPNVMRRIRDDTLRTQPRLEFYPVVYYERIRSAYGGHFLDLYARYFEALVMPFRDDPYRNNLMTDTLRDQLTDASQLLARKRRKLILMVYAHPLSDLGEVAEGVTRQKITVPPDVDYVRRVTSVGLQYSRAGRIAGVIQYVLPLKAGQAQLGDMTAHSGRSLAVAAVDGGIETHAGDWAGALTWIALDPGSGSCRMTVWKRDSRTSGSPRGYHVVEVVVAGRVLRQLDVARDGIGWDPSAFDLTPLLTRGRAQLILRLYEKSAVSNYRVRVRFDDVTLTGCHTRDPGFERGGDAWTYIRRSSPSGGDPRHGPVIAGRHTPDPDYSTAVFNAVASLYAG
jgi:hypothetical protein